MTNFSPGLLQGCFELLEIVESRGLLIEQICPSFGKFGSIPSERVLDTAQHLKWLIADSDGFAVPTVRGNALLVALLYETRLRLALLDYVEIERPPWLQNAAFGRDRVMSFVSSDVGQVFVEARLTDGNDDDVVWFWDSLAARARGHKDEALTRIGRQGEKLSITYETNRTGHSPKWISIEDNADGYDILSIVSSTDTRPLPIEVKASTLGLDGYFHLTRTEWQRSIESDTHEFHLWDIKRFSSPSLAVLSADQMSKHVARDQGDGCWESIKVPFASFRVSFMDNVIAS